MHKLLEQIVGFYQRKIRIVPGNEFIEKRMFEQLNSRRSQARFEMKFSMKLTKSRANLAPFEIFSLHSLRRYVNRWGKTRNINIMNERFCKQ